MEELKRHWAMLFQLGLFLFVCLVQLDVKTMFRSFPSWKCVANRNWAVCRSVIYVIQMKGKHQIIVGCYFCVECFSWKMNNHTYSKITRWNINKHCCVTDPSEHRKAFLVSVVWHIWATMYWNIEFDISIDVIRLHMLLRTEMDSISLGNRPFAVIFEPPTQMKIYD